MPDDLTWMFRPRCFILLDPRELPLPHNPARCTFYDPRLWNGTDSLTKERSRWLEVIEVRWRSCHYHAADWRRVAEAACWVLREQLEINPDVWSVEPLAYLARLPEGVLSMEELAFAESLFIDPVTWTPGEDTVSDGQHRSCALRQSGAFDVPVLDESRDDTYPQ